MRVRPSTLTLLCLFSIGALDWVIPEMRVQFPGQFLIASAIGTAGLVLLLLAILRRVVATLLTRKSKDRCEN